MTQSTPLLRQHDFLALLGARLTNGLATSALATVVGFQVYTITGDPLSLGWLGLVEAIPALSLVLFGGHVADRRDRRSIILICSAVVTASAVALALLSLNAALTLLPILAVIFVTGLASGFERPALTAFEAQVIPLEQAVQGVSYQSSVSLTGSILGPVVGGIAVAVIGLVGTYGLIAGLLAISTICLFVIPRKPMPEVVPGESMMQSLSGGVSYVRRTPALIGSMALDLFAVFFGGAIALLPVFATDILHVGPVGLGVLRTAPSLGALGVMLIATRRPPSRHAGRTLLISVAGFGVSMIVFGLSTTFLLSWVALFFSGVTDGLSMVIRNTILRVLSPERIRGRVASVNWVFIGASNELGAFESGIAASVFGTVRSVVGGGFITLAVVAAVAIMVPTLRHLDIGTAKLTESAATGATPSSGAGARASDGQPWPTYRSAVEIELAVLALLVAGYALVAARLDRLSIGPALAFMAIGIVLADDVLGPISITPDSEAVRVLAETTLTLLLFVDASTIRARALAHDIGPVSRLLVIGLPLTIALGAVAAVVLFPGIPLGLAVLIGATLAPTDAALSQAVISNQVVPARIRRLLNVESGLNDGIATPFVVLGIALSVAEGGGTAWLGEAVTELVVGVAVGLLLGFVGGRLLRDMDRRAWTSQVSRQLFVLALAASCYLVSVAVGGNGFIGAFVGGLAFGSGTRGAEHEAVRFTELQGSLLAIGVWVAFGLTLAGHVLTNIFDPAVLGYAALSLTVIRMVPVAVSLIGSRFAPPTIAFIGWFGPRGLASIVFLILGLDGLEEAGIASGPLASVVAWTVLLSVVLHGLSAGPLAAWYGRRTTALPEDALELVDEVEPRPPRVHWGGEYRLPPST